LYAIKEITAMEALTHFLQQAKDIINNLPEPIQFPWIVAQPEPGQGNRSVIISMMFMSKENFIIKFGSAPASFSVKGPSFLDVSFLWNHESKQFLILRTMKFIQRFAGSSIWCTSNFENKEGYVTYRMLEAAIINCIPLFCFRITFQCGEISLVI
jgi:hypothetical protein